jgi:CubicO group peptidase (beta-lactamase class C family)
MKKYLVIAFFFASMSISAQSWQDTANMIDNIMNKYKNDGPGAEFAISRNRTLIYSTAKGMADLEHMSPFTKTTKTEAGSVSKQFTAAAILLLEQQGKLSINDDIRKYLPEIKDYGHVIRIYHLLHHTSGLRDWGSVISHSGWPRGTRAYTNNDAFQIIIRQKSLNNIPGDEYIYSNSNYTALTMIVQRVSGMSHAAFTKKYLFEPAGMKNTEWRDDHTRVVHNRAIAYSKEDGVYVTNMPNEDTYGHGGLLTTAEDLLLWNQFYLSGKFGSPSLFSRQTETMTLNSGKRNGYAAGLSTDPVNGWKAISHTGNTAAYFADLEYFPEMGLSFAWLSNTTSVSFDDVPYSIRNLFVKNLPLTVSTELKTDSTIDWKKFIPFSGAYRNEKTGSGFKLYSKDNGIYLLPNGGPLRTINNNTLGLGRGRLLFPDKQSGKLTVITAAGDTVIYSAIDTALSDPASLQEYTGTYFSDETESYMYVELTDGKLFMYPRKEMEEELMGIYKDAFIYPGAEIWFERDIKKGITNFYITIARARKVEFRKVYKIN